MSKEMNDEMYPDKTEFEVDLMRLVPASDSLLAEETFYRAGWNAAMKAHSHTGRTPKIIGRGVQGFTAGLVCGLACVAAGLFLWNPTAHQMADPVVERQSTAPAASEADQGRQSATVVMTPENVPQMQEASGLTDLFAMLSPGQWLAAGSQSSVPVRSPFVTDWARDSDIELLRDQRRRYRHPIVVSLPAEESTDGRQNLRAFPAIEDVVDELL